MTKYQLAARKIVSIFNEYKLTYDETRRVVQLARKQLGLIHETVSKKLPKLPSTEELDKFWETVEKGNNLRDILILKLASLTGCRNSEICNIKISDVDLIENKIFINQGKGSKDRYVVFPNSFSLTLRSYILTLNSSIYLFPSSQGRPISTRRFQQITKQYVHESGIDTNIHPHKFRHMLLTRLTEKGMPDSMIQLISGHSSKDSLAIYQHMALPNVQKEYEKIMKEEI